MRHLAIFPDPVVEKFSDVRFYRSGDYLTINGKYLDAAARERDIMVTIGGEPCNLTALANRALTCQPPPEKPNIQKFPYDADPDVLVKIGGVRYGDISLCFYHGPLNDALIYHALQLSSWLFII